MKKLTLAAAAAVLALSANSVQAQNQQVQVTITSNAPTGGVALTPLWGGFHDGSFDSYNGGSAAVGGIESIAEDGDASALSQDFLGGLTYVSGGTNQVAQTAQTSGRVDFVAGSTENGTAPPIQPGETAISQVFSLNQTDNKYFSYASMILPSSDFLVFNGNPLLHDISSIFTGGGPISFEIGIASDVNDAGTEVNDFATSAGNPLFGLPGGQTGPNQGVDEFGVITNVTASDPFASFANAPAGVDLSLFNFNNVDLYENGIATITITAVPEPSSAMLLMASLGGLATIRRRK